MRPIDADKMILELCKFVVCRLGEIKASDIKKFIDNQPTVNDWIPCSERLPSESGHYLCAFNYDWWHGGMPLGIDIEKGNYTYEVAYYACGWNKPYCIAWQPLPTAFSESEVL